uniref:Copper transport protein n=1 Tax=Amphora coffeiformis TaxID=265554 RepID=A0A7S3PAP3_9STRA|mmetsp:Transcript_26778/g.50543  ORF Transcript_26778/g.50543 Transcript_26778/m.50543 type:complete len:225 (+) Transcript_26778:61-735(+)
MGDYPFMIDLMYSNSTGVPAFCSSSMGGGMIMYMDGFKFSLAGEEPCLNLFFPDWTLDSRQKFYAAMAGVFFLAIFVEGLSNLRYRIVHSVKLAHRRRDDVAPKSTQMLRLVVTLMHGLQGLVGYMLMLAIMTFSVELLLAAVLGLAIGYGIFFQYEEALGRLHVTTNPCCSFLEGEAREIQEEAEEEEEEETEVIVQETPATNQQPASSEETTMEAVTPEESA